MKVPVIVSLLLIKSLISSTDSLYLDSNIKEINSTDIIRCCSCERSIFNVKYASPYRHKPIDFSYEPLAGWCDGDVITVNKTAGDLCAFTIEPQRNSKLYLEIKAHTAKKQDCINNSKNNLQDSICEDTDCKKISLCCDTDLCNAKVRDNLEMKGLSYYFDNSTSTYEDDYSKYTDTACELITKKTSPQNYIPCVVVTNKKIRDYNKKLGKTPITNAEEPTSEVLMEETESDDDATDTEEIMIKQGRQTLNLPNRVLLKFKIWLKFLDENDS